MASVDDIRVLTAWRTHPKRLKLQRRLGTAGPLALLDLWLWAGENRTGGLLTGMDDDDVEIAAQWSGSSGAFIEAALALRLLDKDDTGTYRLHDWAEHQRWADGAKRRSDAARAAVNVRWAKRQAILSQCDPNTPVSKDRTSVSDAGFGRNTPSPYPSPYPSPSPLPILAAGAAGPESTPVASNTSIATDTHDGATRDDRHDTTDTHGATNGGAGNVGSCAQLTIVEAAAATPADTSDGPAAAASSKKKPRRASAKTSKPEKTYKCSRAEAEAAITRGSGGLYVVLEKPPAGSLFMLDPVREKHGVEDFERIGRWFAAGHESWRRPLDSRHLGTNLSGWMTHALAWDGVTRGDEKPRVGAARAPGSFMPPPSRAIPSGIQKMPVARASSPPGPQRLQPAGDTAAIADRPTTERNKT